MDLINGIVTFVAGCFTRRRHFRLEQPKGKLEPSPEQKKLARIESTIRDYHFALDTGEHGLVRQREAFAKIAHILGLPYEQGTELDRRRYLDEQKKCAGEIELILSAQPEGDSVYVSSREKWF